MTSLVLCEDVCWQQGQIWICERAVLSLSKPSKVFNSIAQCHSTQDCYFMVTVCVVVVGDRQECGYMSGQLRKVGLCWCAWECWLASCNAFLSNVSSLIIRPYCDCRLVTSEAPFSFSPPTIKMHLAFLIPRNWLEFSSLKSNLSLWIAEKVCNCYSKVQTLRHCQHRWRGKIWIRAVLFFWQKSVNKKALSTRKNVVFTIKWLIILPSKWVRVVLNVAQLN